MNKLLAGVMDNHTPQFNKNVTEGTAKEIFKTIPEYLDELISSSIRSLVSGVDLVYLGYRKMNPKEEYEKTVINKDAGIQYDLAVNDVTMLELKFSYMGKPINRYLYLPFADRGNLINMGDTLYHILPVLSDTVISPNHKEVFVRLLKAKLTFKSVIKNFIVDNDKVPGQVIHSEILRVNPNQITDNIGKPLISTSLYLAGKLGIKETIKNYTKTDDVIITDKPVDDEMRKDYIVYESTKLKPRGLKEYGYNGHDVKILISRKVKDRSFIDNFIFGIIYTLDILPEQAGDLIEIIESGDTQQEIMYWRIMLGRVSYKNSFSIDRISADLKEHYEVLDGYIDNLIKRKLAESGVHIDDFFDLLTVIMTNYNTWLINSKEYNSDINNRYIDILYYILYDIIVGFNKVILGINRRAGKKPLSEKEVIKIFNNEFSPRKIFGLTKSTEMNLAIALADYTGDIMYPKLTAVLEDQSRGNGVRRGGKNQMPEAAKTLKSYDLLFGSLLFLGKEAPSPRFKANPFMNYNVLTGKIAQPHNLKISLDLLNNLLQGRASENSKILDSELINTDEIV